MKDIVCIVCPVGCRMQVDEENGYAVTGNSCKRGEKYGREEVQNPKRVLTSTVKICGAEYPRCPVKLDAAIPKAKIFEAMAALNAICLDAPVSEGDIIIPGVAGTDANFISTKSMNTI